MNFKSGTDFLQVSAVQADKIGKTKTKLSPGDSCVDFLILKTMFHDDYLEEQGVREREAGLET